MARHKKPAKNFMAVDQFGQTYSNLGKHPRKELMVLSGASHAARMYMDKKDGRTVHVGWVIKGYWLRVYEVVPMEVEVR